MDFGQWWGRCLMTFSMNLGKSRNHVMITWLCVYSTTLDFGLLLEQLDILTFDSLSPILHKGWDRDPAFSVPSKQAWPSVREGYFFVKQNGLPLMMPKLSLMPTLQSHLTAVWLTHSPLESKVSHLFSSWRGLLGRLAGRDLPFGFLFDFSVWLEIFSL